MFDYLPKLETLEEVHKRATAFAIKYGVKVRVVTNDVRNLAIPEIPDDHPEKATNDRMSRP